MIIKVRCQSCFAIESIQHDDLVLGDMDIFIEGCSKCHEMKQQNLDEIHINQIVSLQNQLNEKSKYTSRDFWFGLIIGMALMFILLSPIIICFTN